MKFFSVACALLSVFPVLMAMAMVSLPAAHGGVVLGIVPLVTAGAAALVAHERPSAGFWTTNLVGAAIVVAFVLSRREARTFALGDLYTVRYRVGWCLRLCTVGTPEHEHARLGGGFLASRSAPAIFDSYGFFLGPTTFQPYRRGPGLASLYFGLVSQFFAFFVFNAAMAMTSVARVAQLMLLQHS